MATPFIDRVKKFHKIWTRNLVLGTGDPVQDLADFVRSEIGRNAHERLDDSKALVLYFKDERERESFVALVRADLATRDHQADALLVKEMP